MTSVAEQRIQVDPLGSAKALECIPVLGHLRSSLGKKEDTFFPYPHSTTWFSRVCNPFWRKTGTMAAMLSAGTRQRIVLTVHRALFEGYKLPCSFESYVEEEIEQLLLQ